MFAFGDSPETVQVVSPKVALPLFNEVADLEKSHQTSANFDPIYKMAKEHIFKDNTKAPIDKGRRQDALAKVKILGDSYPQAKDFCLDLIKVIKDLDGLPNGVLKEIVELKIDKSDIDKSFQELKELVPQKYLENILKTAERANDTSKLIVLSEELIA